MKNWVFINFISTFIILIAVCCICAELGYEFAMQRSCPQAFEEMALTQEEL